MQPTCFLFWIFFVWRPETLTFANYLPTMPVSWTRRWHWSIHRSRTVWWSIEWWPTCWDTALPTPKWWTIEKRFSTAWFHRCWTAILFSWKIPNGRTCRLQLLLYCSTCRLFRLTCPLLEPWNWNPRYCLPSAAFWRLFKTRKLCSAYSQLSVRL